MFLSAGFMGVSTYFVNRFLLNHVLTSGSFMATVLRLIICIVIAVFVYCFFIIMLGVVRKRDSDYIPFISKFEFLLRG